MFLHKVVSTNTNILIIQLGNEVLPDGQTQSHRASSPVGKLLSTFAFCGCLTEDMKLGDMLQHPVTFDISLNINKTWPQLRSMKKLRAHLTGGVVRGHSQLSAADICFLNVCSNVKDQTSDLLGQNLSTWVKLGLVGNEAPRTRESEWTFVWSSKESE